MNYTSEEYEFAMRMLHHRDELADAEVEEWMKEPEHLLLLEELATVRMVNERWQGCEDMPAVWKRLHRELFASRQLRYWLTAVAASVVLALGAGLYWRNMQPEVTADWVATNPIVPGSTKAQLILSTGKVIDLKRETGEITIQPGRVVRNDTVEGLKFRTGEGEPGIEEEYHILQVPAGGFYKLELPDGSKVWLNAASELRFPAHFGKEARHVWLKGEGYFEVAKEEYRRFQVHLEEATITVLGTSFNVSAYADEKKVATTLVSGTVSFQPQRNGQEVVLSPGHQCVMEAATGKTTVKEVDTGIYTSWVEGRFVFRFMNLESIMRQLQRWYDFELTYLNPEIREYEFRGVIQRDSRIEEVFRAIELATDVRFKMNGRQVTVEKR